MFHSSLASMNVKSPLSSSRYVSNPSAFITSRRDDNLPFIDFVVSAIINMPLVTRHLLASLIYSDQFLPIKDSENTATSRASSAINDPLKKTKDYAKFRKQQLKIEMMHMVSQYQEVVYCVTN
jgi:hypothetical protein